LLNPLCSIKSHTELEISNTLDCICGPDKKHKCPPSHDHIGILDKAAAGTQPEFLTSFSTRHRISFPLSEIQARKAQNSRTAVKFPSETHSVCHTLWQMTFY